MRDRTRVALHAAMAAASCLGAITAEAQPAPRPVAAEPTRPPFRVDSSSWSPRTRAIWRIAAQLADEEAGEPARRKAARESALAALPLDTMPAGPTSLVVWRPWRDVAARAVTSVGPVAAGLAAAGTVPTVVVAPARIWNDEWRDGFVLLHDHTLHQRGRRGSPTATEIAAAIVSVLRGAIADRVAEERRTWLRMLDPQRADRVHGDAWALLAFGGLDGMRRCAAGDVPRCLRIVRPVAEDSVTGWMGDRDVRAAALADTFPLGMGLKQGCAMGPADACWRWYRQFHGPPTVALPEEIGGSLLRVAVARGGPGALTRFLTSDPDQGAVLARVAGEPLPTLVTAWRDTVAAAGRRARADDGRMAWLGASTIGLLLLGTLGVRRDMA